MGDHSLVGPSNLLLGLFVAFFLKAGITRAL